LHYSCQRTRLVIMLPRALRGLHQARHSGDNSLLHVTGRGHGAATQQLG